MLPSLLGVYVGTLLATYVSTVLLILCKQSWGPLPRVYVKLIELLQSQLTMNSCVDQTKNNDNGLVIGREHLTPAYVQKLGNQPFDISTSLLVSGIESILQDDVSRPFLESPRRGWWILSFPAERKPKLIAIYLLGCVFRWGFLFPLRLLLLLTSFVYVISTGIIVNILPIPKETTLYFGITFAKLLNAAMGIIVRSHDKENRPRAPGIAVANHLTANDVMHIYGDCNYEGPGYTITGQSHGGVLQMMEKFGGELTPALWLDREDQKQRENFQKMVIDYSSRSDIYPVLLFPEGYCTNNTTVLQFRKAVFTGQVRIWPVAISQNNRVGDAFWREDTFIPYLLRVMSSWALYYDMFYLPAMEKRYHEDESMFAARVQSAIAGKVGCMALPFDGGLKKPKNRRRFQERIQTKIAELLCK